MQRVGVNPRGASQVEEEDAGGGKKSRPHEVNYTVPVTGEVVGYYLQYSTPIDNSGNPWRCNIPNTII